MAVVSVSKVGVVMKMKMKMMGAVTVMLLCSKLISAADPDPLQDICVAVLDPAATMQMVNGYPCKAKGNVTADDFFFAGLSTPGDTNNAFGSKVTFGNVQKIPGLNTLGLSFSRIDFAPGGLNPPHTHPRASEIVFILKGELDVGFITTANVLISKTVKKGEVFVVPRGLVHFQKNNRATPASLIVAFNSQLPGLASIGTSLFGAKPPLPDNVLAMSFQISVEQVKNIKAKFM